MHGRISPMIESVLAKMRGVDGLEATPYDMSDDWLRLRSKTVSDYALFQKFRLRWPTIVGLHMDKVALVHCKTDPHAGLWLHDLSAAGVNAIFRAGCHEIATWNQPLALVASSPISGAAGARM